MSAAREWVKKAGAATPEEFNALVFKTYYGTDGKPSVYRRRPWPPRKPQSVLSKYRKHKIKERKHDEWMAEHNKPAPPEPPPRKEYKALEQDKVYKIGYHRPDEKQWVMQDEEDYCPQPERTPLITIEEAVAILEQWHEQLAQMEGRPAERL